MQKGSIRINTDFDALEQAFGALRENKRFKMQMNRTLRDFMDPYVPAKYGDLAATAKVTPRGVEYDAPYAHYQYTGVVYGPNFLTKDGFFSKAGVPKYPTGHIIGDREGQVIVQTFGKRSDNQVTVEYVYGYTRNIHPLATHHWDVQMMEDVGEEYTAAIKPYIMQNLRKRGRRAKRAR